jgi:uncharacterized protein YecT (DUF1311 family)
MRNAVFFLFALILFALQSKSLAGDASRLSSANSCDAKLSNREHTDCLIAVANNLDLAVAHYVEAKRAAIRKVAADERGTEPNRADLFGNELEEAVRSLERAQASWVAYRDAHCDMIAKLYLDGTGKVAGAAQCSIDLTTLRIRELWTGPGSGLPAPN